MLVRRGVDRARLPEQEGRPLLHVDYLSAAPWNLYDFPDKPRP